MDDLRQLVERSRLGDLDAFSRVVERFQDMAIGYAEAKLGDFHAAEDAAQESFIDAYLKLDSLKDAAAFPGWFRRIVQTRCNRVFRKRRIAAVPIEEGMNVTVQETERREMREEVLSALRALPESQRVTTTLFYINGYSQNEIAEFLEVPVTTVQKRLHDSRRKLKETMMNMVEETLKRHAADERFSRVVIDELLMRPKPLEIDGHPVRVVADTIREALSNYEHIVGDEVIDKRSAAPMLTNPDRAYHVSEDRILRTETTVTGLLAAQGRALPVRLLVYGRVFRADEEDASRLKVFHQLDVLHIGAEVTEELMYEILQRAVESVLGRTELRYETCEYPITENGIEVNVTAKGKDIGIAGAGMLARPLLSKIGFDPDSVRGFCFGMGLERLALIKHGLEDIRSLWRPPYVTKM